MSESLMLLISQLKVIDLDNTMHDRSVYNTENIVCVCNILSKTMEKG